MNTIESNKLIAEFMGIVYNDENSPAGRPSSSGRCIEYKKGAFVDYEAMGAGYLNYDNDWNELMPVWIKCRTLYLEAL